jgi:hypothetical protein
MTKLTNDQIHELSTALRQLESAEADVEQKAADLYNVTANRDALARKVERLRGGQPAKATDDDKAATPKELLGVAKEAVTRAAADAGK